MNKEEKKVYADMDLLLFTYNRTAEVKLNQQEYCEKYGITQPTFGNYRSGKLPEAIGIVKRMAEDAGLSLDDVIQFTEDGQA